MDSVVNGSQERSPQAGGSGCGGRDSAATGRSRTRCFGLAGLFLAGLVVSMGCAQKSGRIMGDDEDDLVGAREAGAPTYDRLITESIQKLLANPDVQPGGLGKLKIAFAGVENQSGEALGSWHGQIETLINTSVNNSRRFRMISSRYVEAGLKQLNLRADDLFIKGNQRRYAEVMEEQGQPLDCLLFATIHSAPTRSGGTAQVNYLLNLELVNLATGDPVTETATLRKEYTQ